MYEHKTPHEGKRRNNGHDNPDDAASENGFEETDEQQEGCSEECDRANLSPVNWGSVGDWDGRVVGELFCEGGRVKTAGEIVLCGIYSSVGGFPGTFSGRIDGYDWSGHEIQLDGG